MAWVVVDSTVIEKFRYQPKTSILEIEFKSGAVYHYFDVPAAVYHEYRERENRRLCRAVFQCADQGGLSV